MNGIRRVGVSTAVGLVLMVLMGTSSALAADRHPMQAWVARYNGPGNSYDWANAVAVDAAGNVYVTGRSAGSGTSLDYATIKYDSAGNLLWVARYNGPGNGSDSANALAVDAAGNVYVTGGSGSGPGLSDPDYATIKYDSAGNLLWVARYNGPGNGSDRANALAVDATGNVYVTGGSEGSDTLLDYATIKYDSAGNLLWVARYNGLGNVSRRFNSATALAVDAAGNVYTTGSSGSLHIGPGTGFQDYATVKYDSAGNPLWVARYNGPDNVPQHSNSSTALAVDAAGNVYVTGGSASVPGLLTHDYATIKYDSAGNPLWVARYNGPDNSDDNASALAVDNVGNVYVTGLSRGSGTGNEYATVKYDSAGNLLWVARYNEPVTLYSSNDTSALAVGAAGNVYVTGGNMGDYATVKYAQCDFNGSGHFDLRDILKFAVGCRTGKARWGCDYNGDDRFTTSDTILFVKQCRPGCSHQEAARMTNDALK